MAEPPPVGGQTGATTEPTTKPLAANLIRELFDAVIVDIDAGMRIEKEDINAIESNAIDFGFGGQVEHRVEVDAGSAPGLPLPTRPGHMALCSFGKVALAVFAHCFRRS